MSQPSPDTVPGPDGVPIQAAIGRLRVDREEDPRYPPVDYRNAEEGVGRYISFARHMRRYSPDPSTKVAALILSPQGEPLITGVNRFPAGLSTEPGSPWLERPLKYDANTHAERGAIFAAAREGVATKGCSIVVEGTPCVACATAIAASGIKEVIVDQRADTPDFLSRWADKFETSIKLLGEAGVKVTIADVDESGRLVGTTPAEDYRRKLQHVAEANKAKAAADTAAKPQNRNTP